MTEKEKIRPIYYELKAYLAEAPPLKTHMNNKEVWERFNDTISQLNEATGENYDKYKMEPRQETYYKTTRFYIWSDEYRQSLNGLIQNLRAKYFLDEKGENAPALVSVSQQQHQIQNFHVQMLLEIQSKIDEKRSNFKEGDKEKGFLDKLKESLSSIKNWADFAHILLQTAKDFGLTPQEILTILF